MISRSEIEPFLIDKIKSLPDYILYELMEVIANYPEKSAIERINRNDILKFAGCWKDFEDFEEFTQDIKLRHQEPT